MLYQQQFLFLVDSLSFKLEGFLADFLGTSELERLYEDFMSSLVIGFFFDSKRTLFHFRYFFFACRILRFLRSWLKNFFEEIFLNVKIALLTNVVTAEIARKTSWTIFFCLSLQLNLILCKLWRYTIFTGLNIEKGLDFRRGLLNFWAVFKKVSLSSKFRKGA